jgi:hypothetical protein
MRCVAVIEAERPGLDSVILWDNGEQLVAFAYQDGKVSMTRPLEAGNIDQAVSEVQAAFQINAGQLTRVTDWQTTAVQAQPIPTTRRRW